MDLKKRKLSEKAENGPEPPGATSSSSPASASASASALTEDDISQLLDPLSRDQLLQIARRAASSHPEVLSEVRKLADRDPAFRKLFVRGLSWNTSREKLRSEFSSYGEVEDSIVISDKSTGKSKGFGFVTFKHREGALRALKEPSKKIDGQMTVCHLSSAAATSAPDPATSALASSSLLARQTHQVSSAISNRKVYVGNLPKNTHGDALLEFFSRFGEVEEGPLGLDRGSGKCKGFALFIYKSPESAKRCLAEPSKLFNGSQIHCKLAEPSSHKSKDDSVTYNLANSSATSDHMYNPLAVSYDRASPGGALANAYNPSSLGHSFYGSSSLHAQSSYGQSSLYNNGAPGAFSSYGILDPLSSRGTSSSNMLLRGHDSMLESGSVAASLHGLSGMGSHSSLGLPMSSHLSHSSPDSQNYFLQSSRIHPPLKRSNAPSFDYPSLSRSPYY